MSRQSRFSSVSRRSILTISLALIAVGAAAQDRVLDEPRRSGAVGERYDGYAVVRDRTQAARLAPIVDKVNAERRAVYSQRATAERVPVEQIGRVYAAEILKSAPPGTWFLEESGRWVQKR